MKVDESINHLAEKLDAWFDGILPLLESSDAAAQSKALLEGIEILNEFDRIKEEGLATLGALINRQDAIRQDERVASLLQAFIFAAKLWAVLGDTLPDMDAINKIAALMRDIVIQFDTIEPNRASLAALLDHPHDMVRVSAGERLIKLMPERVVPVLRAVEQTLNEKTGEAGMRASLILFAWEGNAL
jgi:hypothetical protein